MYKSRLINKYEKKKRQNQLHPAFIQEIYFQTVPTSSPALHKYVISMDGKRFFLVSSHSARNAVKITMGIGANPDPQTTPPPSPGKPRPKSVYKALERKFPYKTKKRSIIPISKDYAIRLVNEQISTHSQRSAKKSRLSDLSSDENPWS